MRSRSVTRHIAKRVRAFWRAGTARLGSLCTELSALKRELLATIGYGSTGPWGERIAALHIQRAGTLVLTRNWFVGKLEADIIALDRRTLVVVEVKTRHESLMYTFPARHSVTAEKAAHLSTLARAFVRQHAPLCRRLGIKGSRVDTIEVYYRRTYFKRHHARCVSWHKSYIM